MPGADAGLETLRCYRRRVLLFRPSFIDKEASGIHDTALRNIKVVMLSCRRRCGATLQKALECDGLVDQAEAPAVGKAVLWGLAP